MDLTSCCHKVEGSSSKSTFGKAAQLQMLSLLDLGRSFVGFFIAKNRYLQCRYLKYWYSSYGFLFSIDANFFGLSSNIIAYLCRFIEVSPIDLGLSYHLCPAGTHFYLPIDVQRTTHSLNRASNSAQKMLIRIIDEVSSIMSKYWNKWFLRNRQEIYNKSISIFMVSIEHISCSQTLSL